MFFMVESLKGEQISYMGYLLTNFTDFNALVINLATDFNKTLLISDGYGYKLYISC